MPDDPLRVCHLLSLFHPIASGAERQALLQGEELVARGHEVHVLTRAVPGRPSDEMIRGVQVHRWIRPIAIGPLFGLSFVRDVIAGLRRLKPRIDIIHTHQALWESIACGLGRDLLDPVPVLIQPASAGFFGEAQEMARTRGFAALRRLALRNRHFAAISAEIEREWIALGVPPDRIVRMASAVETRHFRPGAIPESLEDQLPPRPRVVFTGRLHPQKNLDTLLRAWPEVAARHDAHLLLIGDGPLRDEITRSIRELGLDRSVHLLGASADPADLLRASDLFVLPSLAEGMSNSLLEAMATGLPCLASAIGGNSDLIEPNRTGLLVDPDNPTAWGRALIELLDDPPRARALGTAARTRIEREFALPVIIARYVDLYRRLIDESRSGRRSRLNPDLSLRSNRETS
jgi:glycosyltransferase involved in cell wall biosynthesis